MREKTIKVYRFEELNEKAQKAVLDHFREWQVNCNWWDFIYEDAAEIGLEIEGFDLDRGAYVKGRFSKHPLDVCYDIKKRHGKNCETYKTAMQYFPAIKAAYEANDEAALDEVADEFLKALCEDYRILLQKEYEYLTSDEAVREMIEANDYEFLENGKIA